MGRRTGWLIAIATAALAAGTARAEDWRVMPVSGHDFSFVDADSIVRRADGGLSYRGLMRLDENGSNSDFGYDRIDLDVRTSCAPPAEGEDPAATSRRTYSYRGRRVAEPDWKAVEVVTDISWVADQLCRGVIGSRKIASIEDAMRTRGDYGSPDAMAAFESDEVQLTGTVVQGFEINGISLCGSEAGCTDDAPSEFCWLIGPINVPVPPGAQDWQGGSPRRDSADVTFRGKILRSRTGRGFGHLGAFGCQVQVTGPVEYITITQRRPPPLRYGEEGKRPEAVAASAALLQAMNGAGGFTLANAVLSARADRLVAGSGHDATNACYTYGRLGDGYLDHRLAGFSWNLVRSVRRDGAAVTVETSKYDEGLHFYVATPAAAARQARFAEELVAGKVTGVEQAGRQVTVHFETGAPRRIDFADAGEATEAAGLAWRLRGREIARVQQNGNNFSLSPVERVTVTFADEAKATAAADAMAALRTACAPAPGE